MKEYTYAKNDFTDFRCKSLLMLTDQTYYYFNDIFGILLLSIANMDSNILHELFFLKMNFISNS